MALEDDLPAEAARAFKLSLPQTPEQALWYAVALRTVRDACGYTDRSSKVERDTVVREARRFLRFNSNLAEVVFDAGGVLDFWLVRRAVLSVKVEYST